MSFSFSLPMSRTMLNSSITRVFGLHLTDKIVRHGTTAAIAFTTPAEPKSGAGAGDPSTPVRTSLRGLTEAAREAREPSNSVE